ncbi:MAG: hypothetical protein ACP5EP_05180 [Acidobacteriaceae bacterium]
MENPERVIEFEPDGMRVESRISTVAGAIPGRAVLEEDEGLVKRKNPVMAGVARGGFIANSHGFVEIPYGPSREANFWRRRKDKKGVVRQ